jgi:hypothetical protein
MLPGFSCQNLSQTFTRRKPTNNTTHLEIVQVGLLQISSRWLRWQPTRGGWDIRIFPLIFLCFVDRGLMENVEKPCKFCLLIS